ncbi:peptidase insulinase like peptidase [Cryptosporidium sp. chipmunk genotype I]|uniref:peptidase insulinase like peptidase n=1 Tax=Cryptosporidium sp. chipmunk genotype I TaxID=1280935 RepID=UPI00351A8737|nr:peptidase insulinase like peptidase [Cryptosporidium sp. chipmunk genotype I]
MELIFSNLQVFISNFSNYINDNDFIFEKERYKIYFKKCIHYPDIINDISYIHNKLFLNQEFNLETHLHRLENIQFDEFINFSKFFLSNYKLEGFFYGNINPIQSLIIINKFSPKFLINNENFNINKENNLFSYIISGLKNIKQFYIFLYSFIYNFITGKIKTQNEDNFKSKNYFSLLSNYSNSIINLKIIDPLSLKKGSKIYYYHISKTKNATNAVLMKVLIAYNNYKNNALIKLLTTIISGEFFTEIRTKKQLGYIVHATEENFIGQISGIEFFVRSSYDKNIQILTENILEFWNKWFSFNSNYITENLFNIAKKSILKTLKNPVLIVTEEFSEFSYQIQTKKYDFYQNNKTIYFLKKLKYHEFLNWYKTIYENSNIFLYAIQSSNFNENDIINQQLSNYVPQNFTKFNPSDSLFNFKNITTYNQWNTYNEV